MMKPAKGPMDSASPDEVLSLAETLADAWVKHVWEVGEGTLEAYVEARTLLVRQYYPTYAIEESGDRPKRKRQRKAAAS
jgi:hypothetical protein